MEMGISIFAGLFLFSGFLRYFLGLRKELETPVLSKGYHKSEELTFVEVVALKEQLLPLWRDGYGILGQLCLQGKVLPNLPRTCQEMLNERHVECSKHSPKVIAIYSIHRRLSLQPLFWKVLLEFRKLRYLLVDQGGC